MELKDVKPEIDLINEKYESRPRYSFRSVSGRLAWTVFAAVVLISTFVCLNFSILLTDSPEFFSPDLEYRVCGWPLWIGSDDGQTISISRSLIDALLATSLVIGTASYVWKYSPNFPKLTFSLNRLLAVTSAAATIGWMVHLEFGDMAAPFYVGSEYAARPLVAVAVFLTWFRIFDVLKMVRSCRRSSGSARQ